MAGRVTVTKIIDETEYPFYVGDLTGNGLQFDTQQNTNADATFFAFGRHAFNTIPTGYAGGWGSLKELEVELNTVVKSDNGDAIVYYKAQGRELTNTSADKPWVDFCTEQVQTSPINAAWQSVQLKGWVIPQANFNTFPIEVRMLANVNTAEVAEFKIRNTSYVRYRYIIGPSD